jgi:hypothetical protein
MAANSSGIKPAAGKYFAPMTPIVAEIRLWAAAGVVATVAYQLCYADLWLRTSDKKYGRSCISL